MARKLAQRSPYPNQPLPHSVVKLAVVLDDRPPDRLELDREPDEIMRRFSGNDLGNTKGFSNGVGPFPGRGWGSWLLLDPLPLPPLPERTNPEPVEVMTESSEPIFRRSAARPLVT
jgi:hypothetical protein